MSKVGFAFSPDFARLENSARTTVRNIIVGATDARKLVQMEGIWCTAISARRIEG